MIKKKKRNLTIILITIIVFCIWFIVLDFSRFCSLSYEYDVYPSAILKRVNVVLAAAIVWTVGKDGLNPGDSRRMKGALLFACLGEAIFAIRYALAGVLMFAACQTLLTIRNSTGIRYSLKHADHKQRKELIVSASILLLLLAVSGIVFSSLIKLNSILIFVYLYGILLSVSLWSGYACFVLALLPKRNSKLAAGGMLCFFCCDILVGLDAVLETGLPWLLANSFIWVFYIPALVLLALSSYRYDNSNMKR